MPFFETRLAFGRFWVKEHRHSENVLAETSYKQYLYRRTRLKNPFKANSRSFVPQNETAVLL